MIIEYKDIRSVRPIADNMNDEKRLLPYIKEGETLYLKPLIAPALYKQIVENKADYEELLAGGDYDNERKSFPGLREAMGYLIYSRFVRNQNVNNTAFGLVTKKGEFSEPSDDKTVVRVANDAEKIGFEYLDQCIEYMKFKGMLESCKRIHRKRKFKAIGK